MSGYSKRMMEVAAAWHRANPDPSATDLQLPIKDKIDALYDVGDEVARIEKTIAEARAVGRADVVAQAEDLLARLGEIKRDSELDAKLEVFRSEMNKPYRLSQNKLVRPSSVYGEDDLLSYAVEVPWLLAWARDGYNVFDLSPDFVAAMLLTDPSAIDLPSLKLPFSGMLFMIPDRFATGAEGTSYTKIHVVETDDSRTFDGTAAEGGEKRPAIAIYATDGTHLLATVAPRSDLSWATLEELPDDVTLDLDREARTTIQRIVFGTLAYATAVDRSIEERFPSPKKRRESPSIAHWTIGRTIKLDPELVRTARGGAREIAFRLKSRHAVRGHYRDQAHGPGRTLRTERWIAPHWRGPEEGARLVHTYKPSATGSGGARE